MPYHRRHGAVPSFDGGARSLRMFRKRLLEVVSTSSRLICRQEAIGPASLTLQYVDGVHANFARMSSQFFVMTFGPRGLTGRDDRYRREHPAAVSDRTRGSVTVTGIPAQNEERLPCKRPTTFDWSPEASW